MDTSSSFDDVMLKGAVMSASLAMAITDPHQPDNPIIFINPAFSQMTGYAAASVVGQNCRFLQGPDTNPDAVLKIRAALIARKEIQVDILNYRKDGSPFMNRLFVSPVLNAQGDLVHFFASQFDASEIVREDAVKRRREAVLRYLANQLGQRLSSTMDVVQALVSNSLTSASSIVDASESIAARLVALGQVHRKISEDDWDDEDFATLIDQITRPFRQDGANFQMRGPSLRLSALLSIKLSSAVYELCLNSTRHFGKWHDQRSLRLEWNVDAAAGQSRLRFSWYETGGTGLSIAEKKKLYRNVLVLMNDPQVLVSLQAAEARDGLSCVIEAPLR